MATEIISSSGPETLSGTTSVGTEACEDYLKSIYALARRSEDGTVSTSALAQRLEVSAGAVTAMLKRLAEADLIRYRPYHGAELTRRGERTALEVIRHHRLLECYLVEVLGMPWDRVHAEAEVLEHHISEELEGLIAAALDEPGYDPHGDPIPSPDLVIEEGESLPLGDLAPGSEGLFVRISDSDSGMLRYLADRGISPGDRLEVVAQEPYGGSLRIRIAGSEHHLGRDLTAAMRVERLLDGPKEAGS